MSINQCKSSRLGIVLTVLLISGLSGCLFGDEEELISINIDYNNSESVVEKTYVDGQLESTSPAKINFDFKDTKSKFTIVTFGLEVVELDLESKVTAKEKSNIEVEFYQHGSYELVFFAIDKKDNRVEMSFNVSVDLRIDWTELSTNDPIVLEFDPRPANGGLHAKMIEVESTVENPNILTEFGGGRDVEITWNIIDETNDVCQKNSGVVANGEQLTWETIHFNTYLEHEMVVIYEDGQDSVNVYHSLLITYSTG